jgi:ATP-dependent DNA helicase RecG
MKQPDITELLENTTGCLNEIILTYKKDLIEFDYYDVKHNSQKLDLNERQVKLLTLLQQKVFIKRREYIKLFKVSPMTAYRDLNYLTEKSLVVVGGKGKSTTYTLATKS